MWIDLVLSGAARGAVILALALAALPLLRRAAAATRRLVLALALAGALAAPVISVVAPAWHVAPRIELPDGREDLEVPIAGEAPAPAAPAIAAPAIAAAPAPAPAVSRAELLVGVWLLGAGVVIARLALGLARARGLARRATPDARWFAARARAETALGVQAEVRSTTEVDAPAVTGVVWPVVLVPRASGDWSEARRTAVLLHELAHVRQRDCIAQIVAQLACAAHWFNPLAWLAVRRLRVERELAADDAVLVAGTRASSYAEDLLAISGAARALPVGALGIGEGARLVARIGAVLAERRARFPLGRAAAGGVAVVMMSLVAAIACAAPAPSPPPPAPTPRPPRSGATTIDPRLQAIATDELARAVHDWHAAAGAVIVLDPATGEIRAASDVGIHTAYVTGSTLKAITLAGALDDGVVVAGDRFDAGHGARAYPGHTLHDAEAYGTLTLGELLAVSSNIGFSRVFDRLGGNRLDHWLRAFHFGAAPPIDGAGTGELPAPTEDRSFAGAMLADGERATATPLQVAAAYAALANGGVYVAPTLSPRRAAPAGERIIKPETARTVVTMLEGAVDGPRATGKLAQVAGVQVAGKTGTAVWDLPGGGEGRFVSFVGFVPAAAPRYVIFVGLDHPTGADNIGGKVAAPVFSRIATRALAQ